MQSFGKILAILDLIDEKALGWTFDDLHARLGYKPSTLYRYLKCLTDTGLLTSLPDLGYTLGPRIIELDYLLRRADPLLSAARPVMQELVAHFPGVALLCRFYRNKVLCVHQEFGKTSVQSNYERGKTRPLFRGAASVVILANLRANQLAALYKVRAVEFLEAGFGQTLREVKATLKPHRQRGWLVTRGEVTPSVVGIAAPIFDASGEIVASFSLTMPGPAPSDAQIIEVADKVTLFASITSRALSRDTG